MRFIDKHAWCVGSDLTIFVFLVGWLAEQPSREGSPVVAADDTAYMDDDDNDNAFPAVDEDTSSSVARPTVMKGPPVWMVAMFPFSGDAAERQLTVFENDRVRLLNQQVCTAAVLVSHISNRSGTMSTSTRRSGWKEGLLPLVVACSWVVLSGYTCGQFTPQCCVCLRCVCACTSGCQLVVRGDGEQHQRRVSAQAWLRPIQLLEACHRPATHRIQWTWHCKRQR